MATRPATQADVDNPIYYQWIKDGGLPPMQVGDYIIDDFTTSRDFYRDDLNRNAQNTTAAFGSTGNNIGDPDLVLNAAIPAGTLPEGVIRVYTGTADDNDYYHYSSWSGSTFILDATDHPSGLLQTYTNGDSVRIQNLRRGFTIWMDSVAMDIGDGGTQWTGMYLGAKDGSLTISLQYMSSLENPITFRPLRGRLIFDDDFQFWGINHVFIDGDSNHFPGLRDPSNTYMYGSFGIALNNSGRKTINNLIIQQDSDILLIPEYANNRPSFQGRGVEAYGGFATFRVWQGGNADDEILAQLFEVTNCYFHDGESEGLYIGHTGNLEIQNPRIEKVTVVNNLFARRGTESIQIQSFLNNSIESVVANNIVLHTAAAWIAPFQPFQSGGQQYVVGDGNVLITNNIYDTYIATLFGWFGNSNGEAVGDVLVQRNLSLNGWNMDYHHGSENTLAPTLRFLVEQFYHLKPHSRDNRRSHFTPPTFDRLWGTDNSGGSVTRLFKHIETEAGFPANIMEDEKSDEVVAPTNVVKAARNTPAYNNLGLGYNNDEGDSGGYDYLGIWGPRIWPIITVGQSLDSPSNPGTARFLMTGGHELATGAAVITSNSSVYTNQYYSSITRIDNGIMEIDGLAYAPRISNACTGGGSSTSLQDTVNDFTTMTLDINDVVRNVTDGSECIIVSIDSADQVTTTALTGGSDNTWTSGDTYEFTEQYSMYIGAPMEYLVDEVVSHIDEPAGSWTNPGVKFYKCILQHSAGALDETPDTEPTRWTLLQWDANGVRSDKPGYTGTPDPTTGGWFPPDNVLLEANDQWNKKGLGLLVNPVPTDATHVRWYMADDAIGTNKKLIRGAKETFDLNNPLWDWVAREVNKYLIGSVTPVDVNGTVGVEVLATGVLIGQRLWDEIVSLTPWVVSPIANTAEDGGASIDDDDTFALVSSDGDLVKSIKGMGTTLPNFPNLFPATHWKPATEGYNVWYSHEGDYPRYRDRGGFDKSIRIRNGLRITYETGASPNGSGILSPSIVAPYHEFLIWRCYPNPANETNNFWKHQGGNTMNFTKANPDALSASNIDYFKNEYWEYKIDGSGNWEILKNGKVDSSGAGGSLTAYTDFKVGANGHPLEFDFRASLINPAGDWTDAQLAILRGNIDKLWPNVYPSEPHYRSIQEMTSQQQNAGTWDILRDESEGDDIKVTNFRGGSGIEGDTIYRWFYSDYAGDATTHPDFPIQNILDEHIPFTHGRVTLDSGASGSVDGITVGGTEIMSSAVNFITDLPTTAKAVADNINANGANGYRAYAVAAGSGTIYIVYGDTDFLVGGEVIVSSTATIVATDTNVSNNGGGTEAQGGNILTRADYEAGNAEGFPVIVTNPGTSDANEYLHLFCLVEPKDSLGVSGEYILSQQTFDNIV